MGNYRDYFRPDQTPDESHFWQGYSATNQEWRKTHNRRQRAYNKDLIREAIYGSDDYEAEDAEDAQSHRCGVEIAASETPDGSG